jgi:surface polysaccharide O-acyltransferase-like enzyme
MEKDINKKSLENKISSQTNKINRIFFLDNFRTFLIILVVLFHSSLAYIVNANDIWFIVNPEKLIIFDVYAYLFDISVMSMLFFISGYFALSSILRGSTVSFLKKKFIRLGIPLIIGIYFVNPFSAYVIDLYKGNISGDFFNYYIYDYITNIPYTFQLWFLITLIIIIIIFSIVYYFGNNNFKPKNNGSLSIKFLLFFPLLIGLGLFIEHFFISDLYWAGIDGFEIFQPSRLILYISYFFLGVYVYKNCIIPKGLKSNKLLLIFLFTSILALLSIIFYHFFHSELLNYLHLRIINALLWSFLGLFSFLTFVIFFKRKFNYSSKYCKRLSANSYSIFILHYPFVLTMQYLLLNWQITPVIKFLIVVIISFSSSYLISEYIIHRIPIIKKIM